MTRRDPRKGLRPRRSWSQQVPLGHTMRDQAVDRSSSRGRSLRLNRLHLLEMHQYLSQKNVLKNLLKRMNIN